MGPFMGGACGFAFLTEAKVASDGTPQGEDARPVCSGVVWRLVVSKAFFKSEEATFAAHLKPHQLAVSVRSGSEVMCHVARSWMAQHCHDLHRILLDTDEGNAHNEVDRHTFLSRASEASQAYADGWNSSIQPIALLWFSIAIWSWIRGQAGSRGAL